MSEEDVYLISPPIKITRFMYPSQPLGLVSIATHAEDNGYAGMIKVIDGVQLSYEHGFHKAKKIIFQTLKEEKPFIVGFSVYNLNFDQNTDLLKVSQEFASNTVLGGHYATTLHKVLANFGIVVRGEGEETFRELLDELYNNGDLHNVKGISFYDGKKIIVTPDREPLDINNISIPYWGFLPPVNNYGYVIPIEESRRCINNCSFCSINSMYKNKHGKIPPILKTPERIEVEADLAYASGARYIDFFSELTLLDHKRALKIADIMEKYQFKWWINSHPRLVVRAEGILSELRKKGLIRIGMGIEAGSQAVLDYYNKETTPEINSKAMIITSKNDIIPMPYFINFHPDITMEQLGENIGFIDEHLRFFTLNPDYPNDNIFKRWIPVEGTPIYDKLLKEHRIKMKDKNIDIKEASYKDPAVIEVINMIVNYLKNHGPTYERIKESIIRQISDQGSSHSLSENDTRLKNIPFYVLSTAYSFVKDGKPIEEAKRNIDSYCQQEFEELCQVIAKTH